MNPRRVLYIIALLSLVAAPSSAQEIDEAAYSLQNRKYHLRHELYVAPGILPLDSFEKGIIANASYTYHINTGWAVEVAQFAYVWNVDTGLQEDLRRLFGAEAVENNSLEFFGTTNVVVKPIYRKMIWLNRNILHGETFFVAGGGPFKLQDGYHAAIDFGIGVRVYINDWASVRFDFRDYIWFDGSNPNNVLMFALGLSLNYLGN